MRALRRVAMIGPGHRDSLVRLEGVDLTLGGREVLHGIELSVAEGEIVTLIGPNGAGKTSLVRIALGLVAPTRGQVARRPGVRVGYMPQRLAIDPTLPITVGRFVGLATRGRNGDAVKALDEVGALALIDAPMQGL